MVYTDSFILNYGLGGLIIWGVVGVAAAVVTSSFCLMTACPVTIHIYNGAEQVVLLIGSLSYGNHSILQLCNCDLPVGAWLPRLTITMLQYPVVT